MTRAEIKNVIKNAIANKESRITISGDFGSGLETFEMTIDHSLKHFYCDEYFPLCVLSDIRENGYYDYGGLKYA